MDKRSQKLTYCAVGWLCQANAYLLLSATTPPPWYAQPVMCAKAVSLIVSPHVNLLKMCAKIYTPPFQFTAVQTFLNEATATDHGTSLYTAAVECRNLTLENDSQLTLFGTISADAADHDEVA